MKAVYAVDLQHEFAAETVAVAARWCTHLGATLDLLFVDGYEQAAHLIRDPEVRDVVAAQWAHVQASHRAELDGLLDGVPPDVRGAAVYEDGNAREVIRRLAPGYDLVLVATHGRTGLDHVFLGSVAEWLVRHVDVPVMVLRLPSAAEVTQGAPAS